MLSHRVHDHPVECRPQKKSVQIIPRGKASSDLQSPLRLLQYECTIRTLCLRKVKSSSYQIYQLNSVDIYIYILYINNAYKWSDKWSESVKKHRGGTTDGTRLQALVPWWRRSASVRDIRLCLAMLWRWVLRRTGLDKLRRYHKHVAIWENDENVSSQGRRKLFRSSNLVYDRAHLTLEKCHSCFESRV